MQARQPMKPLPCCIILDFLHVLGINWGVVVVYGSLPVMVALASAISPLLHVNLLDVIIWGWAFCFCTFLLFMKRTNGAW